MSAALMTIGAAMVSAAAVVTGAMVCDIAPVSLASSGAGDGVCVLAVPGYNP